MKSNYSAVSLSDIVTPAGVRCTSMELTFPRMVLAELNTHRLLSRDGYEQELSRNSASSRAIPTEHSIARVREFPFIPNTFNARVKGMGVGDELDPELQDECRKLWLRGRDHVTVIAEALNEIGIDKSRANRIMEPWMWHTAVVTATEWENFIALRCPDGDIFDATFPAAPEIQLLAIEVRKVLAGEPKLLEEGNWALPMFDHDEEFNELRGFLGGLSVSLADAITAACMVSARRVARVSYDKHTDAEPLPISLEKGVQLENSHHYSPMEHQVRPLTHLDLKSPTVSHLLHAPMDLFRDHRTVVHKNLPLNRIWAGNLRGVLQFRKLLPYEDNAMFYRIREAAEKFDAETATA